MNELVPVARAIVAPISIAAARLALEDVATVASLVDWLEVIRVAARKAKVSHEAQNDWATVKLEANAKPGGCSATSASRAVFGPGGRMLTARQH
jgi:hypothetical protein